MRLALVRMRHIRLRNGLMTCPYQMAGPVIINLATPAALYRILARQACRQVGSISARRQHKQAFLTGYETVSTRMLRLLCETL